jgi:hypothetical protein
MMGAMLMGGSGEGMYEYVWNLRLAWWSLSLGHTDRRTDRRTDGWMGLRAWDTTDRRTDRHDSLHGWWLRLMTSQYRCFN